MESSISTSNLPAEALGLGGPRAEYRASTRQQVISGVVFFVFAFAAGAVGYLADSTGALIALGLMGLLFLGAGVNQLALAIGNRDMRIVLFDRGLVRLRGGRAEILRWDDISAVYQAITDHYRNGMKTGTTHVFTVHLHDGSKRVYNDVIQNVEALGAAIQQEATARLLPIAAERLSRGEALTFNRLIVSRDGIGTSKQTIPWTEVDSVGLNRGMITVTRQGKPLSGFSQTAAQTPNLFVFLALAERIKSQRDWLASPART